MLSFDDHPGIISFLLGIIVLVMVTLGLSMVVDDRFKYSSDSVKTERETEQGSHELEELVALCEKRSAHLRESSQKPLGALKEYVEINSNLKTLHLRQVALVKERNRLRDERAVLEADFSAYRAKYRRKTWAAAIGEKLGQLNIRGGREYKDAIITRVTDAGLEIRHADGIARIQVSDLDRDIQDRFQMNDENRRKKLFLVKQNMDLPSIKNEATAVKAADPGKSPDRFVTESKSFAVNSTPKPLELAELRRQVLGWQSKISLLKSEQRLAQFQSSHGNQASVPGSLETWTARSERLYEELARAQVSLAVVKAKLAVVSPGDSLLGMSDLYP